MCFEFIIIDDLELEGDHDFTIEITNINTTDPFAIIGSPNKTVVTIADNEGK